MFRIQLCKHKNFVSIAVMVCITPSFKDLSHPAFLQHCLRGENPKLEQIFKFPCFEDLSKNNGNNKTIPEIAVNVAVIKYNEGRKGRIKVTF